MIDRDRARVITGELAYVDADLARAAAGRVLPRAGRMTTGQLRHAVRRAVLAADPQAAIRRRKAAERDARVEAWAEQSGTAALAGRDLSPAGVAVADRNIDATARWLKAHGATGTLANLRAGVFLALLSGRSPATLLPAPATGTGAHAPAGPGFPGTASPADGRAHGTAAHATGGPAGGSLAGRRGPGPQGRPGCPV